MMRQDSRRASIARTLTVAACAVASHAAGTVAAQEPADTSIIRRLERAEQMINLLEQQLAEQATAKVEPRSRYRVELSGLVLLNAFYNTDGISPNDAPIIVAADPSTASPAHLGATARQTHLALTGFAPDVLGGTLTGEIELDFWGGDLSGNRFAPEPRIRRTRAQVEWRNAWVLAGQEAPPISPLNPTSIGATGLPVFSAGGNLWFWIPQLRVGVASSGPVRAGVEAAVLAPTFGAGGAPSRTERSKRPFVQGRLLARWGDEDRPAEVAVGGHHGWIATAGDVFLASKAVAASAEFFVSRYVEVKGEAFAGQALGTLGGGAQGRDLFVDPTGAEAAVRTRGGWVQVTFHPHHEWRLWRRLRRGRP